MCIRDSSCLQVMLLNERQLPIISDFNFGKGEENLEVLSNEDEKLLEGE